MAVEYRAIGCLSFPSCRWIVVDSATDVSVVEVTHGLANYTLDPLSFCLKEEFVSNVI